MTTQTLEQAKAGLVKQVERGMWNCPDEPAVHTSIRRRVDLCQTLEQVEAVRDWMRRQGW